MGAEMDRYARRDALQGLPGFDADKFFIADSARRAAWVAGEIAKSRGPNDDSAAYYRTAAMRRYAVLRQKRRVSDATLTKQEAP